MQDSESGQRGFLLTGRNEYLEPFDKAASEIERHFAALVDLYPDDPESPARSAE